MSQVDPSSSWICQALVSKESHRRQVIIQFDYPPLRQLMSAPANRASVFAIANTNEATQLVINLIVAAVLLTVISSCLISMRLLPYSEGNQMPFAPLSPVQVPKI